MHIIFRIIIGLALTGALVAGVMGVLATMACGGSSSILVLAIPVGIVALPVYVKIMAALFFRRRTKKVGEAHDSVLGIDEEEETYALSMYQSMNNSQKAIVIYILDSKKTGLTDNEIVLNLKAGGWSVEDINAAYSIVRTTS